MVRKRQRRFILSIFTALVMFLSICQPALVRAEVIKASPPLNFKAEASITAIELSWQLTDRIDGCDLEVDGRILPMGTKNSYRQDNLIPGSSHVYRIRAKNKNGTGEWSSALSVKAQAMEPYAPKDFKITNVTNSTVAMSWSEELGAKSYEVEVDGKVIESKSNTSFVRGGFDPESKHTFRVRAKNELGESDWSSGYEVTTFPNSPDTPKNLKLKSIDKNSITIVWDKSEKAEGYEVVADNKLIDNGTSNEFTHKGISINDEHTYFVRAKNSGGVSEWSSGIKIKIPTQPEVKLTNDASKEISLPTVPSNITLKSTENSITVNWDTSKNAELYDIEVDGNIISNLKENTYTQNGLLQGTSHTYRVRAKTKYIIGAWSSIITGFTKLKAPDIPKNLNANAVSSDCIVAAWDMVTGATGYDLEVDGKVIDVGINIKYVNTQLKEASTHYYRVRAKNSAGNSEWSEKINTQTLSKNKGIEQSNTGNLVSEVSVPRYLAAENTAEVIHVDMNLASDNQVQNAVVQAAADTTAPTAPSSLALVSKTYNSVNLKWNASTDNVKVTSYDIYNGSTKVGSTTTGTTYTVTGLLPSTSYSFTVKARDAAGNTSSASNTLSVTTSADTTAPSAPTNLTTSSKSCTSVSLSWTAATDNVSVTGYDVYNGSTKVGSITTGTTYTVTGLAPNTSYSFTVKARDAAGNTSSASSALAVTTLADTTVPSAPTNLTTSTNSCTSVSLSWTAATDNVSVTGYDVYNGSTKVGSTTTATTYTVTGLLPNTSYSFTVKARDAAGNTSSASSALAVTTLADTTAPSAPTNLVASNKSYTSVSLSWSASTDNVAVTAYDIYDGTSKIGTTTNTTTYAVSGLIPNTSHQFTVKARDAAGNTSAASNSVAVTTLADTTAPSAPTYLKVVSKTCISVNLSWTASTDNIAVTIYEIYKGSVKVGETNGLTYTVSGLTPNTAYSFTVKAKDAAGNLSQASTSVSVTTTADTTAPTAPSNLTVVSKDYQSISLSWTASTDNVGVVAYDIYIGTTKVGQTNGETTYTVTGLSPDTSYSLTVKARDLANNTSSASSALVVKTNAETQPPTVPSNLVVTSHSVSEVAISWNQSTDNIAVVGYDIFRDGIQIASVGSDVTSYTDSGLNPNTQYKYTIKAKDQAGNISNASSELSVTTDADTVPPTNPSNLIISSVGGWYISLSWSSSTDNGAIAGYDIYCNGSKVGSSSTTTYKVTGLQLTTQYSFVVKARDLAGNESGESNSVTATTYYDDFGDSIGTAASIDVGKTKSATINYVGDYDYFTFIAQINSSYTITTISNMDTYGYIYDENGNLITYDDDNGDGNNFLISAQLISGHRYYIAARHYSSGTGDYKVLLTVQDTVNPTTPSNVSVLSKSAGTVTISWTASTDNIAILGYDIYRDGLKVATVADGITSYTDTGLLPGTQYKYTVKAKDQAGNLSDVSNEISVTTDSDIVPPTAPTNLTVSSKTGWSISLSWNPSTDDGTVAGYDIYCNGTKVGSSTTTNYTCTGLQPNIEYIFTVKAYDLGGNKSESSNSLSATTYNDDHGDSISTATDIQMVSDVNAKIDYNNDIDYFKFTTIEAGKYNIKLLITHFTSYVSYSLNIYDRQGNYVNFDKVGNYGYIVSINASANEVYYIRPYITSGDIVNYTVRVDETIPPTVPSNVQVTSSTLSSVSLSWNAATDNYGIAGYEIYRNGVKVGTTSALVYTDTGVPSSTTFTYTVKALDTSGNLSDASLGIEARTSVDNIPPAAPTNLIISTTKGWSITLSWNASTDNGIIAEYDIYCNGNKIGSSTTTSYTCEGLQLNAEYVFKVKAIDSGGNISEDSNSITGKTLNDDYGDSFDTATSIDSGKVKSATENYYYDDDYFSFIAPRDGQYIVKITNGIGEYIYLYDKNRNYLAGNYNATNPVSLLSGDRYYVRIYGYNTGNYNFLVVVPDTEKPTTPTNVSLVSKNIGTISISWTASTDNIAVLGYEIYRDGVKIATVADNVTSYTDTGLAPNTAYKYTIKAKDQADNLSDASSELSVTTDGDNTPPTNPTNLIWASKTGWTVSLSWSGSTDDGTLAGYDIYCNGIKVGSTTTTSYTCTGLNPNTQYIFTVKAKDLGGNVSGDSNSVTVLTYNDDYGDSFDTATSIDAGKVKSATANYYYDDDYFSFIAPKDGQYIVKITNGIGEYIYLYDKNRNYLAGNYNATNPVSLLSGDRYYVRIYGYNTGNYNFLVVVPDTEKPTTPTNVSLVSKNIGTISISWTASTDNIAVLGYEIYRDGVKIATVADNVTSYTDTGLVPNTAYKYTVKAKDQADNLSDVSSELSVTTDGDNTPPTNPTNLGLTSKTGWTVSLSWSASTDNGTLAGYDIYCNGIKVGSTTTTSYTCTGLNPNTQYIFTVKAKDLGGNVSGDSNSVTGLTYSDDYGDSFDTATNVDPGKIKSANINYSGDVDYFTFIAPLDGTYVIKMTSGVSEYLYLYDKNRNSLTSGYNTLPATTLKAGERYYLRVPYYYTGVYNFLIVVQETEKPTSPTNVSLVSKNIGTISISWTASTDNIAVLGYEIYRDGVKIATVADNITSYTDTGLAPNTAYKYTIKAKDQADNLSDASSELSVTTDGDNTPPTNPTNLGWTSKTGWTVSLSWSASTDDGTIGGYDIYCNGSKVGSSTTTSYTCTGLNQNTEYIFTVKARDLGGNLSAYSNSVIVSTYADDCGDSFDTAVSIDAGKTKSASIETSYDVDYFTFVAPVDGQYIIKLTSGTSEYLYLYDKNRTSVTSGYNTLTATALKAGDRYYLKVPYYYTGAYNFLIVVPDTEKPTAPSNLGIVDKSLGSITISWSASTDNYSVTGYEVYRDGVKITTVAGNILIYTDSGLSASTQYKYTIKAKDQADNLSDLSSELAVSTDKSDVSITNLSNTSRTGWTIGLSWSVTTSTSVVDRYEIYANGINLGSTKTTSFICTALRPNTIYKIIVKAIGTDNGVLGNSSSITVTTYDDDYGDTFDTATSLEAGKVKSGSINYSGDYDYLTFNALSSGTSNIKVINGTNVNLYLYDKNKNVITSGSGTISSATLVSGEKYYLRISYSGTGSYSILITVPETEKPTVPTGLSVTNKTVDSITISWQPATDNYSVIAYEIYRDGVKVGTVVGDITSYKDSGLLPNTTYRYTIKAKDQADNLSEISDSISGITNADDIPPTNPSGLSYSSKTARSVAFTWNASRDNGTVASYDIYCNGTKVGNTTSTSYTCSGLQLNTLYIFTVRAKDLGGNTSGDSNSISVTTYDDDYGDDFDTAENIQAGIVKSANMNYSSDNDYFIFIAPNDGQYTFKITSGASEYLYVYDKNRTLLTSGNSSTSAITLKAGERYYLKVSCYNTGSYSFLVVVPETEKPTVPTNLNVTSKSEGTVTITWSAATDNFSISGYEVYRNGTKIADVASNVLTFTDSGLSPSTEYKYTVKAKDQANNLSDASSELSVITAGDNVPPSNPTNLRYTARTGNSITLSWSASTDNGTLGGYDIYCNGSKVGSSTTTSYTCTGLQGSTQYLFTVRARDLGGNVSGDSNVVTVSTCLALSLGQDTVINGDFTMHDGDNLNLNGHRFEVHGNFDQLGGTVTINKGLMIITGNYKVSNGSSSGILSMTYSEDYIQVQGNFTMEASMNLLGYFTAGILEVKGNFTQIQTSQPCNFWTKDNHIVLLSGTSVQYISFATAPTSIFNILITTKPLSTGYVFNKMPVWNYLIENYKIDTNFGLMTGDGAYGPTGNFSKSFTDLKAGNDGSDAEFTRNYNSKDVRETTGFGKGWSFSYECSITDFSGNISTKVVRLPDGSAQTFKINTDGTFTAMDSRNTLTKQGDGSYILTTKDQHSYGFNSNGYLVWVKDKNGNTTTINVDGNGKVASIVDEVGRNYTISYNDSGLISTITDCLGRVVKYEYDNKKLVKVTDPMNHFTTYAYDSYGFLTEIRAYDNSLIESITYNHNPGQDQDKVDHTIDQYGNVLTYSYDTIHLKTTITDSNGRKTIQTFDSSFNIISSTDAEGKVTTYEYNKDSSGVNNFNEQKTLTDRNGGVTSYVRDSVGNITKVTNPDGSYKEYVYDSKNNVIREKDENGNLTFYIYDSNGINMVKQVRPLNGTDIYSDSADQTKFAITQYSYYSDSEAQSLGYKAKGLLKQVIDPMGGRTTYTYDSYGNVYTVTDGENNTTTYEYNSIGWKTKATSPQGYLTEYFYDNNGNVEKTILNHSSVTRTVYDSLGRVIKVISANVYDSSKDDLSNHDYSADAGTRYTYYSNGKVKTATDAENNTTTYTYDVYGNKLTETKANGTIYRYVYDVMNRLSKVYFKADVVSVEQLLLEYAYGILTNGSTTKTETKYINGTTSLKTITTFDYAGRVTSIQNPDNTTLTKAYNANGTLSSSKDANGNITYYKYDGLNRLVAIWTPFENVNGTVYYSYTAVEYDKAGRKTKESFGKATVVKDGIPQAFITTAYEYYNNGNLKAQSDSAGRRLEYTYDKDGNIVSKVVKVDDNTNRVTEYTNNEFGKPTTMKVHVYAGDIYTNAYTNNSDLILTTTYTFDKEGNVLTETYPDNSVVSYTYDKLGRILSTSQQGKDENGHDVTITTSQTYNWEGKVLTKTDGNGNTSTYVYDARGFLVKIVDAKGNTTAYYYDLAGRKIAEVSPNNYDASKTLQNLSRTEYNYDLMDRVKTKVSVYFDKVSNSFVTITSAAFKYDNNGNVVKELDAAGYEAGAGSSIDNKINSGYGKIYSYNLANKLLTVLDADSQDRLLPYTKKYTYDGTGRKITETDGKGKVTTWYYDDANNITRTTIKRLASEAEVTVSSATYDNTGDVITATDGNGNITTYEYTGFGKIKKVTYPGDSTIAAYYVIYQYDTVGRVIRKQDSVGVANIYTYDSAGRELTSTEEKVDGTETIEVATTYDKNGNKRFLTDANGTVTENTYDELNRLVTSTIYVTDGSGNKVKHTTSYIYDKNSNLLKEIDWIGNEKTYVYDALDRVVEKYDQNNKLVQKLEYYHNGTQSKSYDALQNVTLYYYDKNNRLIKTVDPEGHITLQHYDEVGNIDQKTDGDNNTTYYSYDQYNRLVSVKNAKGEITNYTYDLNGNMLTQVDAQGNTTTYEYNVANKLIRKIFHGGRTGSSGNYTYDSSKTESYTYYASGDLRTKVDRNGVTSTYTYDIHGRKTSETIGSITNSYSYDDNGNQIRITDATGTTTRTYDELNRVTSKSVPTVGTIVYKYDIISGINGLDSGNFGESETDPKGNVTLKIYDKAGRIKKVIASGDTTTYNYYDNGSLNSVVYSNGYSEEYTYYKDNLLRTLVNKAANGTVIESYSYTYDNAHNMLSKTDSKGTTSYTYDELNRLKTVTEPTGKVTTYTYTSAGNRNTETVVEGSNTTVKTYTYDSLNRLLSIITTLNTVAVENTSYTYDNNGNQLTSKVDDYLNGILQSSMLTTNVYDSLNQLIQTTTPDNIAIKNIYNGEGLRVEKQVGNSSTKYLYSSDKVVLELDGSGNLIARNIYGINQLERITDNNKAYYFYNGHADTTKLIAQDGTVLNSYYYDAFGNITESNENMDNPYRYAGYQYDKETKTYYVIARMYDPSTGRFLQEDSYRGDINDPLSLNLYTYCENEPIKNDDPTGHFLHIAIGALIGGIIGAGANLVSDFMDDGKINSGWKSYAGAFVEGAVVGGAAAATGGLSLLASAGAVGAASFVGNVANQYISKSKVDWKEAAVSGVLGAATEVGGKLVGKLFANTKAGKAILGKVDNAVESLKNKLSAVKEKVAQTAEKSLNSIKNKFDSIKLNLSENSLFSPQLALEGVNGKLPSKALNQASEHMNVEKNDIQKNFLKVMQERDESLAGNAVASSKSNSDIRENVLKNIEESRAAREASRFNEVGVPETRVLSREDAISTIKSTRRQVEKLMKNDQIAQNYINSGLYDQYGTYFHNRVFKRVRSANIEGLEIDKNIMKPGTVGGKGNIRRPDFQWQSGTPDYEIWDLKPNGFTWSNQFQDIMDWTGIVPQALKYNR